MLSLCAIRFQLVLYFRLKRLIIKRNQAAKSAEFKERNNKVEDLFKQ